GLASRGAGVAAQYYLFQRIPPPLAQCAQQREVRVWIDLSEIVVWQALREISDEVRISTLVAISDLPWYRDFGLRLRSLHSVLVRIQNPLNVVTIDIAYSKHVRLCR